MDAHYVEIRKPILSLAIQRPIDCSVVPTPPRGFIPRRTLYDARPSDCLSGSVVGQLDTLQVVLVANEELTVGVGREAPSFAADLHSI